MNKREYLAILEELQTLPVPGTILHPPSDKTIGRKLIRYEIHEDGLLAIIEGPCNNLEMYWTFDQVRKCTWNKTQ